MRTIPAILALVVAATLTVAGYTINAPWRPTGQVPTADVVIPFVINPDNPYGFGALEIREAVEYAAARWTEANHRIALKFDGLTTKTPLVPIKRADGSIRWTSQCDGTNVIGFNTVVKTAVLAEAFSCYEYRNPENGTVRTFIRGENDGPRPSPRDLVRYRKTDVDVVIYALTGTGRRRPFLLGNLAPACTPQSWYLYDVLTHEVGHLIGLGHVIPSEPTMYKAIGRCNTRWRTLAPDDVAGVRALYPQ